MQILSIRRITLIGLSLITIIAVFIGINLIRFDSETWLKAQAESAGLTNLDLPSPSQQGSLNKILTWDTLSLNLTDGGYFETEQLSIELNGLSILLGQPQIESLTLIAPYLETSEKHLSLQALRLPNDLAVKNLSIIDALVVFGPTELHDVQIGMIKNGTFGEFAVQSSGYIRQGQLDLSFSYSSILSIDGDNQIRLSKNTLDSQLQFRQGSAQLIGKIKELAISSDNDITAQFISWSSQWQQNKFQDIPNDFDFAGGLESGQFNADQWQLIMLDAALAYRDADNIGHTYSLQSTQTNRSQNSVTGQLGLSILTEKPQPVTNPDDWQSFNLVMSGGIDNHQPLLSWSKPDIRLAFINGRQERISHNIALRTLDIDRTAQLWIMSDGDWNQLLGDVNTAGYGFGKLTGQWPSLQITEGPTVTSQLQYPLNLLSTDLVTLDALFRHLVQ